MFVRIHIFINKFDGYYDGEFGYFCILKFPYLHKRSAINPYVPNCISMMIKCFQRVFDVISSENKIH